MSLTLCLSLKAGGYCLSGLQLPHLMHVLQAPYVASVTLKVLFSFEQRVKHQKWNADLKQSLEVLLERSAAAVKANR